MEMPGPGPQHTQLERLAGTWIGKETMHPSHWAPEGAPATSRIVAEMRVDGFFLVSDYEQSAGGEVRFRGHGVYGWDAPRERFTMHWFDSIGMDPGGPALGTLEGDRLEFRNESPMGLHRYVTEFQSPDKYTLSMGVSADGGDTWKPLMDAVYERQ